MRELKKILAVLDGSDADVLVLTKAVAFAHRHGAALELFLCDAERAYSLTRAYDARGIEDFRRDAVRQARRYLEGLRDTAVGADVRMSVDATCESPLYEGIVRKVIRSGPDLVIKSAAKLESRAVDANDWQLIRACPATLLLSRGRSWHSAPKLAAAVDMSEREVPDLARAVLSVCSALSQGAQGQLEVLYSEMPSASPNEHALRVAALEELTRELGVPGNQVHVLRGEPERALPAFAGHRGYDAFVMGALTHRKGIITALVGTLTSKLIETLDCDFVLVKPAGYRSAIELQAGSALERVVEKEDVPLQAHASLGFVSPWQLPQREP